MVNLGPTVPGRGRTTLGVLGAVLLLVGVASAVAGAVLFAKGALSDDMEGMGRFALIGIGLFGVGGLLAVLGIGLLNAAFADTRYVRSEAFGVITDPSALFSDRDGMLGLGRGGDDQPLE